MSKRPPINVVIADAGPLISLASAKRLDLLECFDRPIKILDVVKEECLRKKGAPGQAELEVWFQTNAPLFEIVSSPLLVSYRQAVEAETKGIDPHACEGLGDASIAWLVAKIPRLYSPNVTSLVLTEDAGFGNTVLRRNVHVLSTRSFLATLENLDFIDSAAQILAAIATAGRTVARYQADRPALVGPKAAQKTQWTEAAKKPDGYGM